MEPNVEIANEIPASGAQVRTRSNFDLALKNEVRRAGQPHLREGSIGGIETDRQFIAALNLHAQWRIKVMHLGSDESRGGDPRATGQGFPFHSPLERAHADPVRAKDLDKVDVRTPRRE